jgi:type VI secretion system secreted protein VgrG
MNHVVRSIQELLDGRQNNRILRLSFPNNDAPPCELVVESLHAQESMSRDFEFTIEILSDNPRLQLKDVQGKLLSVELVQKGGTLRYFSGYCFSFRLKKAENIAFYEARLGPWLKYLSLRRDSYLFHNATLRQQTGSIFGDYAGHAVWDFKVYGEDAAMTDACQFNETDSNYLHRRWEAAGIHYHYEHNDRGHTLVLADDSTQSAPIDGDPAIRFHVHGGAQEEDAIGEWSALRFIKPASVALRTFDFKSPVPFELSLPTLNRQGSVLNVEAYEYAGAYGFGYGGNGDRLVRLRLEEMEAAGKHFEAAGNNSRVMPGRWFSLVDRIGRYPFGDGRSASANEFLILDVEHVATNNYLQQAGEAPHYSNRLTCIRRAIPWRPGRGFNSVDTRIWAPQTAIVVGPEGQGSIHTDEYGRIRVQFHWDRAAVGNELSSAWIRVSSSWAGAELGAAAVPRVGSEVIVQWLDGSPDRPIVTGCVHNECYMPPWKLPRQGALSGLRSRELTPGGGNAAAGRSNHLILDDTNERIQVQLKSDHQHSQLSLGYITRIESNAGRMEARGEGWELASDAWGVARAGRGMLITTEARPRAASSVKDMGETVQRLQLARKRHQALAGAAQQSGAQEAQGHQAEAVVAIEAQNDALAGGDSGASVSPELAAPHLVLASPAGIATTTSQSTHIASDEHTALTTGRNLSIAAGDSLLASISHTFRLFVHKAGMKLIAAAGKVSISAQSDDIELVANKVLTLISQSDWVDIRGKKGVRLHGGDHMLEIGDKVQFFTSSPVLFHGNLETLAPKSVPQKEDPIRSAPTPEQLYYTLQSHAESGRPHASVPYTLFKGGAKVEEGLTDEFGRIAIEHADGTPD